MFQHMFDPIQIGNLTLPNRFVRSATFDSGADVYGKVTDQQVQLFAELAKNHIGLIISGIASVHPSGRISPFQLDISHDGCIPGLRKIADAVHDQKSKAAVQLFHAGREGEKYQKHHGSQAMAPSYVPDDPYCACIGREMSEEEIREAIEAFGAAAERVQKAGWDAVQVHAAHAYLISQFLSPHTNLRTDTWGGNLRNRFRFLENVYLSIRRQVGSDYPVLVKLGVQDGFKHGLQFAEGQQIASWCAELGFDAIEVSQGLRGTYYTQTEFRTGIVNGKNTAYFRHWAREIQKSVHIPVIMVGGLRSIKEMNSYITAGDCAAVALCRPLIREPDLVASWRAGEDRPVACVSCNKCFEEIRKGHFVHCALVGNQK